MPTDALSEMDYDHKWHCEDCKEVSWCQGTTQRAFWEIWPWVCAWLCKDDPPPPSPITFQNAPPPLQKRLSHQHLWWPRANKFVLFKSSSLISKLKLSLSFALCSFFKRSFDFIVDDNTAKIRVYEPKIFQARLRTKGLYKNGTNWKIRLLRFLNRFLFFKNIIIRCLSLVGVAYVWCCMHNIVIR